MRFLIYITAFAITFSAAATNIEGEAIYIPHNAGSVRLAKVLKYGGDSVLGAEFEGSMIVQGTVQYGRIADGGQDVGSEHEMLLKLNEESAKRLPRFADCAEPSCITTFVVVNAEANLSSLFGPAAMQRLKQRKVGSLETHASLRINQTKVSRECGVHYRAHIQRIAKRAPTAKVAHGPALSPHC
jgi:hypothetical protein